MDASPPRLLLPTLAALWAFVAAAPDLLPWYPVQTGYVAAVALAAAAFSEGRIRRPGSAWAAWAMLAAMAGVSLIWSADASSTARVAVHLGVEVGLLALLLCTPRREAVVRGLTVGAIAAAVCVAAAFWLALFTEAAQGRRLHLWGGDGNHQARAVLLGVLLWTGSKRLPQPAVLLGLVAMAGGLAGSRGAVIAGVAALGLVAWRGPTRARTAASLAVLGAVLGLFLPAARGDLRSPVEGLADGSTKILTSGRDAIWPNVVEIARDHPLIGVGAGAVPAVYTDYAEAREVRGGAHSKPARDAHNLYLEVLASLGPVGLGLLLAGLGLAWRRWRSPVLVFAACSALTVTCWEQKGWWLAVSLALLGAFSRPAPAPAPSPRPTAPG